MPEYLSPGVYVEEVESGPVPITGVSTSIGGMIGLAERGPINDPQLLTGAGDFPRTFGAPLDPADPNYSTLDAGFNALAFAVDGFFANGGKVLYVNRVVPDGANASAAATFAVRQIDLTPATNGPKNYNITAQAVDPGQWPNQEMGVLNGKYQQVGGIRLSFAGEAGTTTTLANPAVAADTTLTLSSAVGIVPGIILRLTDPAAPTTHGFVYVASILGTKVTLPGSSSVGGGYAANSLVEVWWFALTADLLRNGQVTVTETFHRLSSNPDLPEFIENVIGVPPASGLSRSPGASNLIRVSASADTKTDAATATGVVIRGPTPTSATNPPIAFDNNTAPNVLGSDQLNATNLALNDIFIGADDPDPHNRTGLYALGNMRDISMIAIPGQTGTDLQDKLLTYCENQRYRFAILDMAPVSSSTPIDWHGADATPAQVTLQRGNFDSKYGALYYPWLEIPDPFPANPLNTTNVAIPSSGHVMGIYARSDINRGVHKAPANEVVNNIVDFSHHVDTGTQDILNPIGINVLRDFRPENRGLRVWGARTLSSDILWRYVSTRRLFIFLEKSIELGTQWVVFEPNNEILWVRVKQSIAEFLTDVWRTGALMGTKPEQAFYVICDRTTMTQSDLENGRLIVEIGVAVTYPAEFVIFRISQWAGGSSVTGG
jgi:phage tail sheath protein FI